MVEKLSTGEINTGKSVNMSNFREMVNYVNTTNRGYVRFVKGTDGTIKLAKVSKHWYSTSIEKRTNIDNAHNKQMRDIFVDSLKNENKYLSDETKRELDKFLFKPTKDAPKATALSRREIRSAFETLDKEYSTFTKRAAMLQRLIKEYVEPLQEPFDLSPEINPADILNKADKFFAKFIPDYNRNLKDEVMNLFMNGPKEGATGPERQEFIDGIGQLIGKLEDNLNKAVTEKKLKDELNGLLYNVYKSGNQANNISAETMQMLRTKIVDKLKKDNQSFNPIYLLHQTQNEKENLPAFGIDLLDGFIQKVMPHALDEQLQKAKKAGEQKISNNNQGEEKVPEFDFDEIVKSAKKFTDGLLNHLQTLKLSEFSKEMSREMTKDELKEKLQSGLDFVQKWVKTPEGYKEERKDVKADLNLVSAKLDLRNAAVAVVADVGVQAFLERIDIQKDLEKSYEISETLASIKKFTDIFLEQTYDILPDTLESLEELRDKEQTRRSQALNVALKFQYGTLEKEIGKDGKTYSVNRNDQIVKLYGIIHDNLMSMTKAYVDKEGKQQPAAMNKETANNLCAFALPKCIEKLKNDALMRVSKTGKIGDPNLNFEPQTIFDSLLNTFDAYADAADIYMDKSDKLLQKLNDLCDKNIERGTLKQQEKESLIKNFKDSMRVGASKIQSEFFNQIPLAVDDKSAYDMAYTSGKCHVDCQFKKLLIQQEQAFNENMLLKIIDKCQYKSEQGTLGALKNNLLKVKDLAENLVETYLNKNNQKINANWVISPEARREKMIYALTKSYTTFLLNKLSDKKLSDDQKVVITEKWLNDFKASFTKYANKLLEKSTDFEGIVQKKTEAGLKNFWQNVSENNQAVNSLMSNLSKDEQKAVKDSLLAGSKNALSQSLSEFMDRFFSNPGVFNTGYFGRGKIVEELENDVMLASNRVNEILRPIIMSHLDTVKNALNCPVKLYMKPFDVVCQGYLKALEDQNYNLGSIIGISDDNLVQHYDEFKKALKEMKIEFTDKNITFKSEREKNIASTNYKGFGEDGLIDDEMLELLKNPVFLGKNSLVDKLVKKCVAKVQTEAQEKALLFSSGCDVKECRKKINDQIRTLLKAEIKKLNSFADAAMKKTLEVYNDKNEAFGALGETGASFAGRNMNSLIEAAFDNDTMTEPETLNNISKEVRAILTEKFEKNVNDQIKNSDTLLERFNTVFAEQETEINNVIDEELKELFKTESQENPNFYESLKDRLKTSFVATHMQEINNLLQKKKNKYNGEQMKIDWSSKAFDFVYYFKTNIKYFPLSNKENVRRFLKNLEDDSAYAAFKECAKWEDPSRLIQTKVDLCEENVKVLLFKVSELKEALMKSNVPCDTLVQAEAALQEMQSSVSLAGLLTDEANYKQVLRSTFISDLQTEEKNLSNSLENNGINDQEKNTHQAKLDAVQKQIENYNTSSERLKDIQKTLTDFNDCISNLEKALTEAAILPEQLPDEKDALQKQLDDARGKLGELEVLEREHQENAQQNVFIDIFVKNGSIGKDLLQLFENQSLGEDNLEHVQKMNGILKSLETKIEKKINSPDANSSQDMAQQVNNEELEQQLEELLAGYGDTTLLIMLGNVIKDAKTALQNKMNALEGLEKITKSRDEIAKMQERLDAMDELSILASGLNVKDERAERLTKLAECDEKIAAYENRDLKLEVLCHNLEVWGNNANVKEKLNAAQKKLADDFCQKYSETIFNKSTAANPDTQPDLSNIKLNFGDIGSYYSDFKDEVLQGVAAMMLSNRVDSSMTEIAYGAFQTWMHYEGLDKLGETVTTPLMDAFKERIASLQKLQAESPDKVEPIFTPAFADSLMEIADKLGIKALTNKWKEINREKFQKILQENKNTDKFLNVELMKKDLATQKFDNDSKKDEAIKKAVLDTVSRNLQDLENASESILNKVSEKTKEMLFYQSFRGMKADMDKAAENAFTEVYNVFQQKAMLRSEFAKKDSAHTYTKDLNVNLNDVMNGLFGYNRTYEVGKKQLKINAGRFIDFNKMDESVNQLHKFITSQDGDSIMAKFQTSLNVSSKRYKNKELYQSIKPLYDLFQTFINDLISKVRDDLTSDIDVESALQKVDASAQKKTTGSNKFHLTSEAELKRVFRYAVKCFIQETGLQEAMSPDMQTEFCAWKDENNQYSPYLDQYYREAFGISTPPQEINNTKTEKGNHPEVGKGIQYITDKLKSKEAQKTIATFKEAVKVFNERAPRVLEKIEESKR